MTAALDQVVSIWREVLAPAHVGPDTDFFECGGNSLNAAQIVARMAREIGRPVRVRAVFENPSPRKLTAALSGRAPARPAAAPDGSGDAAASPVVAAPLSSQQEALWFAHALNPAGSGRHCVTAVTLPGPLDPERLRAAPQQTVDGHEALRTSFTTADGLPAQVVAGRATADLRVRGRVSRDDLDRELAELSRTPFDVTRPPIIVWALFEDASSGRPILAQAEHLFLYDARSAGLILDQAATAYRGGRWPPAAAGYPAYARWQRDWLAGADAARQRARWASLLAGGHGVARFPRDGQRPKIFSHRGAAVTVPLDPGLTGRLTAAAGRLGVTPFSLLFTAFGLLISAQTSTSQLVVGTDHPNRPAPFQHTVGVFADTVGIPLPEWRGRAFAELARATAARLPDGRGDQAIPVAAIVRELGLRPQLDRNQLFQVAMSMDGRPGGPDFGPDFGRGPAGPAGFLTGGTRLDLDVTATPPAGPGPWQLRWRYYTEVLTAADVTALARQFEALTGLLIGQPGLPLSPDLIAIHTQPEGSGHDLHPERPN
jgi:hypothetical protein